MGMLAAGGGIAQAAQRSTKPRTTQTSTLQTTQSQSRTTWLDKQALPAATFDVTQVPAAWTAGVAQTYSVTVTNKGRTTWAAGGTSPVSLGVHFATQGGGAAAASTSWLTDQRVSLPADVAPGGRATISVRATAPSRSGQLVLSHQMYLQGRGWGADFVDSTVDVAAAPAATTSGSSTTSVPASNTSSTTAGAWTPNVAVYDITRSPASWQSGQTASFSVTVTNAGMVGWTAGGANPVHLGVHFTPVGGGWSVAREAQWATDQRIALPADLAPGASVTLPLTVKAPAGAGALVLEYQMVKEGWWWYDQYVDQSVAVTTTPAPAPTTPAPAPTTPAPAPTTPAPAPTTPAPAPTTPAPAPTTPAPAPAPTSGVTIAAGADIQAAVNANPSGTTFLLQAGTYRVPAAICPKSGDVFAGVAGTVLTGAKTLSGFVSSGTTWYVGGQTQQNGNVVGSTQSGWANSKHPEDLFVDDVMQHHVDSLAQVGPGSWYFDYAADRIYLGTNPAGHKIETSYVAGAFTCAASNVTIQGLTVEKFASPGQQAAVSAYSGSGWVIQDNEIRLNHAAGVFAGTGAKILRNRIHDNGQVGIKAYAASAATLSGNTISRNNAAHFDPFWEAGGVKIVNTRDFVISGNTISDNLGFGVWSDYSGTGTVYENNTITGNDFAGIQHEASFSAIIRNNTITDNGRAVTSGHTGGAIYIYDGKDVEVYGNTISGNFGGIVALAQNRGTAGESLQPVGATLEVANLYVHDNDITQTKGYSGLFVSGTADFAPYAVQSADFAKAFFLTKNNRWDYNTYRGTGYKEGAWQDEGLRFLWGYPAGYPTDVWAWCTRRYMGQASWKTYQDAHSTFTGTL